MNAPAVSLLDDALMQLRGELDAVMRLRGELDGKTVVETVVEQIRLFWAMAVAAKNAASSDVLAIEFTALANDTGLTSDLGRHGAEDIAHVLTWALRGQCPFAEGTS